MDTDRVVLLQSDRFAIGRRLGAGSFGVVYEAYDRQRATTVAMKTLYEPFREGDEWLVRGVAAPYAAGTLHLTRPG